ncbi:siroheme synthase CysG [Thiohalorhabdus denitrificans]|uniref:siroheme synthase CysG n=1 Tax=Thiohalorhabdus denitrificans TaxID=381306 RepID=UPI0009E8F0EC|nr:siroheme synthase CysG [Thiohalorhabdus denitrificans]
MAYLPLFHNFRTQPCLVVGGGEVAERKVGMLRRAGARITVVAPDLTDGLAALMADGSIAHKARAFRDTDAAGRALVVAATGNAEVNRAVAAVARELNVPVNAVDDRAASSAIMPAVVDRSPLVVAVSSGGASPVLARRVRARLERDLEPGLGPLAALADEYRHRVRERLPDFDDRLRFWERALDGEAGRAARAGRDAEARAAMEAELAADRSTAANTGEVYLVGAGPGDPDLLTLKAARLMGECDVVLHDRLVPSAILDRVRRDAERIPVGKAAGCHSRPQGEINGLLIDLARAGKRVLRLKGGDPLVFGRGAEEWEAVTAAGIPCQVVPGVTAASGCAAATGIPLTHRGVAESVTLATGHGCRGEPEHDWAELAQDRRTSVFYMGLGNLPRLRDRLLVAGRAPDTPTAVVVGGTTPAQEVVTATLAELPEVTDRLPRRSPALIIVGEVVRLRGRLLGTPLEPAPAPGGGEVRPSW